jgi:YHS domain-containing protein
MRSCGIFLFLIFCMSQISYADVFNSKYKIESAYPDSINKGGLYWVIGGHAAIYTGGLIYLNHVWYKDRDIVPFHFYNDNAGYLQIDKFGHSTTAFVESNISYLSLRKVGVSKNHALIAGGLMGFMMQLPIEIADGLNEGWGFSWGDVAANTFGSALFAGQEYFFDDQVVLMKFSYCPSIYADMANGYLGNNALEGLSDDYNGHTYWFSGNINRITGTDRLPPWLNIAVGYSAGGMFGEFENITEYNGVVIPETQRYRQFFLSLDIDWTKIPTNSHFLEVLFRGLNIIKVPFPAIQFNSKGEFKGHYIYF